MADIPTRVTADPSQFIAALSQADEAVRRLSQTVAQGGAPFATLSKEMKDVVASINPAAAAYRTLQSQLDAVRVATMKLGEAQSTLLLNKIADNATLSYWKANKDALDNMSASYEIAGKAAGKFQLANAGVAREVIVLGHEIVSGNFSRIPGSLMVMGERVGGLGLLFSYTGAAALGTIGAITAVAGAIGYLAYEAYQGSAAIRDTNDHIKLLGQGLLFNKSQVEEWQSDFIARFGETQGSTRALMQYLDNLGGSFTALRPQVATAVEGFAAFKHLGLTEAAKEWEKQFGTTSQSFLKGAEALGVLDVAQIKYIEDLQKSRDEEAANALIMDTINSKWGEKGAAIRQATAELQAWALATAGGGGFEAIPTNPNIMQTPEGPFTTEGVQTDPAQARIQRLSQAATERFAPELQKQIDLHQNLENSMRREGEIHELLDRDAEATGVTEAKRLELEKELSEVMQTQHNIMLDISKLKSPEQQDTFKKQMEQFAEQKKTAGDDAEAQKNIQAEQTATEVKYYGVGTSEALKAEFAKVDAARKAEDQKYKIFEDGIRLRQAAAFKDQEAQLALEKELIAKRSAPGPAGEPSYYGTHTEQERQDLLRLQSITNQVTEANYQRFAASHRDMVQEAKGDFAKINAIYQEWLAEAASRFKAGSVEWENVHREMVRAAQAARDQVVRDAVKSAEAMHTADNAYLSAFRANMQLMVHEHKLTQEQALGFDIQYTAAQASELKARYEAIMSFEGSTQEQRLDAWNKLIVLSADYTKNVVADQEKIAAAADKTAKQIADSMSRAFASIGTELEKVLTGALTGQKVTRQEFAKSIITSIMGEVGTIGSQLVGGKLLAPALGITGLEGGKDSSISVVLGTYFSKLVGMGGDDKAKDSTRKAQADLTEVTKKSLDYQDKLTIAVKELTEAMKTAKGIGTPGSATGRGGAVSPTGAIVDPVTGAIGSGTGVGAGAGVGAPLGATSVLGTPSNDKVSGTAQAAIDFALQSTGEKLKNYCAILVNKSLEAAGVAGSGSGLASSFKTYGTGVSQSEARKGDIFYSGPSGEGDTGHVGIVLGPVVQGKIPVMSSHMQGSDSNPAGSEWRDASNLTFRRPNYPATTERLPLPQVPSAAFLPPPLPPSIPPPRGYVRPDEQYGPEEPPLILPIPQVDRLPAKPPEDMSPATKEILDQHSGTIGESTGSISESLSKLASALSPISSAQAVEMPKGAQGAQQQQLVSGLGKLSDSVEQNYEGITRSTDLSTNLIQSDRTLQVSQTQDTQAIQTQTQETKANTDAIKQLSQKATDSGKAGGGGAASASTDTSASTPTGGKGGSGGDTSASGDLLKGFQQLGSGISTLTSGIAVVNPHLRLFASAISFATGLPSLFKNLTSGFELVSGGVTKLAAGKVAETAVTATMTATKATEAAVTTTTTAATTVMGTAAVTAGAEFATAGASASAGSAAGAVGSGFSAIGTLFKAIPFIGGLFGEQGGIVPSSSRGFVVPSAAGGMLVGDGKGGQLGVLHPEEMVLPAPLSRGIQQLITQGINPIQTSNSLDRAAESSLNNSTSVSPVFNYNPNITGYHPYETRSAFEGMMRTHGGAMQSWVENQIRNGAFGDLK